MTVGYKLMTVDGLLDKATSALDLSNEGGRYTLIWQAPRPNMGSTP